MAFVVTDHRKYKYFDDLKSAAEYIKSQNDSSLKLYEDTGWGALKEIPPLQLLQMLEGSSYASNAASAKQNTSQHSPAQQESQSSQKQESQPSSKTAQQQDAPKKKKKEPESSISGVLVSLLVKIVIILLLLILYFVFLPNFISNTLENIPIN